MRSLVACAGLLALFALIVTTGPAELRIRNTGATALHHVVVMFPEERVDMGDIDASGVTAYRPVRHGVGPYASFAFQLGDHAYEQFVEDFVGWRAISGRTFTYDVVLRQGTMQPFLDVTQIVRDR